MDTAVRIEARDPGDFLEVMTRAVFQGGISWSVVNAKWDGIRQAFHGFDANQVADMVEPDIDRLAADPNVIRNRRKLEATVANAQRLVELDEQHAGFRNYLRSFPDYQAKSAALRKDFKFLGDTGCYYFLYVVGEDVPGFEEWCNSRRK